MREGAAKGRIDKRAAILNAAFTVFSRRGYEQACVQEIAEVAGVAKPTVYNHFSDKENLFRQTIEATADTVLADNLVIVDRLRESGGDLRAGLEDVAFRLLRVCCAERSRALRRLTFAQVVQQPDLVESVHRRTSTRLGEALADRLARLCLSGSLRACDPAQAAEQLLAMLTGPIEARSRMGSRKVSTAEVRAVANAAVDTFLRAYAAS